MAVMFGLLGIVVAFLLSSYFIKPQHVKIEYPDPPGFARINTPGADWSEKDRTRMLPNGDTYVIPVDRGGHFVMLFDWPVRCRIGEDWLSFVVPRGSTTDFANIPRPLRSVFSPLSNSIYAAVLHDYLYRAPLDPNARAVERLDCDRTFYWFMRACGVRRHTAWFMYLGVRLGGSSSYKRPGDA